MNGTSSFLSLANAKKKLAAALLLVLLTAAFSGLFSLTAEPVAAADRAQCADGKDNDSDGLVDYPQDDDCENLDDDFEGRGTSGLFISIRDDKETIAPGGAMNYVITLKQQRDDARVVNVSLNIPHQVTLASASDGGALAPGRVTWTNVSVYKNVPRTLTVQANLDPNTAEGHLIVARVLAQGTEATDTTLVERGVAPDTQSLKISVTDGKEFARPGDVLNYTVRVRNDSNVGNKSNVSVEIPWLAEFLSATEGYKRKTSNITWPDVSFEPKEEKTFQFAVRLDDRAQDRYVFRTRVYAGISNAVDQTVIRVGLPYNAISASITDNRQTVEVGQDLHYVVTVRNNADVVGTNVNISASVPHYAEFVSSSEGGKWDGSNVRWLIFQIAPNDTRQVEFTIRVRPDAPIGASLLAGVTAEGSSDRDTTQVAERSTEGQVKQVMFRKGVDRSEVVPGGDIRYTLYVRNTLDHTISDAVIMDRYDGQYMSFVSTDTPGSLVRQTSGEMEWKVPVLAPGQTWQASYILRVSEDAPNAADLNNVASISGRDVSGVALSERVRTVSTDVFTDFPTTGGAMDALIGLVLGLAAIGSAAGHRRLGIVA